MPVWEHSWKLNWRQISMEKLFYFTWSLTAHCLVKLWTVLLLYLLYIFSRQKPGCFCCSFVNAFYCSLWLRRGYNGKKAVIRLLPFPNVQFSRNSATISVALKFFGYTYTHTYYAVYMRKEAKNGVVKMNCFHFRAKSDCVFWEQSV